ncbi:Uu.00g015440.m01.CDS01 [Anthostomella pinea]|uniref:Uu.00g015440.m01.CDS01 n=1 Tax=Anthostomella pinea TaxID=933095 RepID=A0AAI8VZF1_9PEZI|nr:Uu.00g015440.m01.CDS01 [Anthostomella pinea]
MQSSRFQSIRSRFSPTDIRTSFRRSSSASSETSSSRHSFSSNSSSPVTTINYVLFRQPSILDMENEKKISGSELNVLEPRPIVYWGGVEERMGSL